MVRKYPFLLALLPIAILVAVIAMAIHGHTFAVLDTKGVIADKQKSLLIFAFLLSLVVIVPVYGLTIAIAWKYRAGNTRAKYRPNWDHSYRLEAVWWGIPCAIIVVLSVMTWQSSHSLDPSRPISSTTKPLRIQVIALQWKWLFIYPEQRIATVNHLPIPMGTPLEFDITSDAPMNSFWIPQLGGQIYAMSGMTTRLNLLASKPGNFRGSSANISGRGFADMYFTASATSPADFEQWVTQAQTTSTTLTAESYMVLARPSTGTVPLTFSAVEHNLYNTVQMKYTMPGMEMPDGQSNATKLVQGQYDN